MIQKTLKRALATRPTLRERNEQIPLLIPLMTKRQKLTYFGWVVAWIVALVWWWAWWLRPENNIGSLRYLALTIPSAWLTVVLPCYFLFIFAKSRIPSGFAGVPSDLRVAMVVTKAPSEPFSVLKETLEAMLRQTYPHDTWLADEDPSEEVVEWCRENHVKISTRKNRADYHRPDWPRRTRCKEGNLAFFYDQYGYEGYDFVSQLDADHVPEPTYLEEMLRPFGDPRVGYVSAPSICDKNAGESWSARGRLYAEGNMHGPLQAGYTGCLAPMCIGSHYAVRTTALNEIGGLGPELAEDHSTTLIMNAYGWRGVHAFNAIAHGCGPQTFSDLAMQEFQWSRSLMTILLAWTPIYFSRLPKGLKFQFGFCQIWYLATAIFMSFLYVTPQLALLADKNFVGVNYTDFLVHGFVLGVVLTGLAYWIKSRGWARPVDARFVSWEGVVFVFARWPWVVLGTIAAVRDWLFGTTLDFRVTPKGRNEAAQLPMAAIFPYIILSLGSALPVLFLNVKIAVGFYMIASLNAFIYASVAVVIIFKHWQENPHADGDSIWSRINYDPAVSVSAFLAIAATVVGLHLRGPVVAAKFWGSDWQTAIREQVTDWGNSVRKTAGYDSDKAGRIEFGIYDPGLAFSSSSEIAIDHVYIPWQTPDVAARIQMASRNAVDHHRKLFFTIEPWTKAPNWRDQGEKLFEEILSGRFNDEIRTVCGEIGNLDSLPFVRWGHEMEGPSDRYPWARKDPKAFVEAFRYFVRECRASAPNVRFVWSPIGEEGLDLYYPGSEYTDYIGLSLYGLQAWDVNHYGRARSFTESLESKYALVSRYEKPIIIAEVGVSGDENYRIAWLEELAGELHGFGLLRGVIYFNDKEPHHWDPPYGSPDWRIGVQEFPSFRR
jgi:cellulose synthase (UDP-forming)